MKKIHMGRFNAEQYWRPKEYAELPQIYQKSTGNIVNAMDELLFCFAEKGDTLLTATRFNPILKEYLHTNGFEFSTSDCSFEQGISIEAMIAEFLQKLPPQQGRQFELEPYAVISEGIEKLVNHNTMEKQLPSYDDTAKVNSKEYSTILSNMLMCNGFTGKVITTIEQLAYLREDFDGDFILKDLYGVSGKGLLRISNKKMLQAVVAYLSGKQKAGMEIRLVAEPFLSKKLDFSAHYLIRPDGTYELLSVQLMLNRNFLYGGSTEADSDMIEHLETNGYFKVMEKVVHQLYFDGYFGYVDIDSMITESNRIVPIIEINARKSMGLINYALNSQLKQFGTGGLLTSFDIGLTDAMTDIWFFEFLQKKQLLFSKCEPIGIMPISMNTLFTNRHTPHQTYFRGRFYAIAVAEQLDSRLEMVDRLKNAFMEAGIKLY